MTLLQFVTNVIRDTVQVTVVDTTCDILYEGVMSECPSEYLDCELMCFEGFGVQGDVIIKIC